ncbi:MAG: class I SAM-dependent methyltransferase [Deltaproteobacteria bacterium]|nr:MAG: class I SAM-dependent methyltransferase [Deltaproteobacteria bacterium]
MVSLEERLDAVSTFILAFIVLIGTLFGLKIAYVVSTALVLPTTQGALYVSTSRVRVLAFLDAVPMQEGQLLVDLGCGDGRVLRAARKRYGVRGLGYELNLLAYLKAQLLCLGSKGIEIRRRNFWTADLSEADTIFCYLFPDVMKKLSAKLKFDLKPGAVVVSCNFVLPGFNPDLVLRPGNSLDRDPIYVYQLEKSQT